MPANRCLAGRQQRSVVGVEYSYYLFGYDFFDADGTFSPLATVNLFHPEFTYDLPPRETLAFAAEYGSHAVSGYFDHQVELTHRLKLLAGGRLDRTSGFNYDRMETAEAYSRKNEWRFSPRVGIVYSPIAPTDVFGSYATSFKPNVFGTDESGRAYDAETGEQWEAGVRHELVQGRMRAQAALYQITKRNVVVYEPPDFRSSRAGTRRSEGAEVELAGSPLDGLSLTAGYAFVRARILADSDPANVGARLFGVPRHQVTFWGKYEVSSGHARGLSLGYGLFHLGARPADEPPTLMLPAYVRHDAMVGYRRGRVHGQVNVENLTGARVYDTHGYFVYPRAKATVRASVNLVL